ncbi:hypothetical protein LCM10_00100 [Rossellomorea aquimaris]|uniref:hypothetical protein n=1 Tax=Rossellomorea aquimaris TaxID=189382 RepID=UPI001CD7D281|nr:hypothetical protein [Rossellomorea aquimaris]MCA1053365.1 hypothetical protein [Rossellomorea aquimaris]
MTSKPILAGFFIGIGSGIILGLVLKFLQALTGIKVYVLLLNVDFIPYFGDVHWSEWAEFLFHLVVSTILGILFVFLIRIFRLSGRAIWLTASVLTFPAFLLYFPLSLLAIKEVPDVFDPGGITLWFIGHVIYGATLPILYFMWKKQKSRSEWVS